MESEAIIKRQVEIACKAIVSGDAELKRLTDRVLELIKKQPELAKNFNTIKDTAEKAEKGLDKLGESTGKLGKKVYELQTSLYNAERAFNDLFGVVREMASIVGAGMGWKEAIGAAKSYNNQILALTNSYRKWGADSNAVEASVKGISKQLGLAKTDVLKLLSTFEKSFNITNLSNAEKLISNIRKIVGSDTEAISAMMQQISGLTTMFPELETSLANMEASDQRRLESQAKLLYITGQISSAQYKGAMDYIKNAGYISMEETKRREEMQLLQNSMEEMKKAFQDVAIEIGKTLTPALKWISDILKSYPGLIKAVGWGGLAAAGATAALGIGGGLIKAGGMAKSMGMGLKGSFKLPWKSGKAGVVPGKSGGIGEMLSGGAAEGALGRFSGNVQNVFVVGGRISIDRAGTRAGAPSIMTDALGEIETLGDIFKSKGKAARGAGALGKAEAGATGIAEEAGVLSKVGKFGKLGKMAGMAGKALPFVGIGVGLATTGYDVYKGATDKKKLSTKDYISGGLDIVSAIAPFFGPIGLGVSAAAIATSYLVKSYNSEKKESEKQTNYLKTMANTAGLKAGEKMIPKEELSDANVSAATGRAKDASAIAVAKIAGGSTAAISDQIKSISSLKDSLNKMAVENQTGGEVLHLDDDSVTKYSSKLEEAKKKLKEMEDKNEKDTAEYKNKQAIIKNMEDTLSAADKARIPVKMQIEAIDTAITQQVAIQRTTAEAASKLYQEQIQYLNTQLQISSILNTSYEEKSQILKRGAADIVNSISFEMEAKQKLLLLDQARANEKKVENENAIKGLEGELKYGRNLSEADRATKEAKVSRLKAENTASDMAVKLGETQLKNSKQLVAIRAGKEIASSINKAEEENIGFLQTSINLYEKRATIAMQAGSSREALSLQSNIVGKLKEQEDMQVNVLNLSNQQSGVYRKQLETGKEILDNGTEITLSAEKREIAQSGIKIQENTSREASTKILELQLKINEAKLKQADINQLIIQQLNTQAQGSAAMADIYAGAGNVDQAMKLKNQQVDLLNATKERANAELAIAQLNLKSSLAKQRELQTQREGTTDARERESIDKQISQNNALVSQSQTKVSEKTSQWATAANATRDAYKSIALTMQPILDLQTAEIGKMEAQLSLMDSMGMGVSASVEQRMEVVGAMDRQREILEAQNRADEQQMKKAEGDLARSAKGSKEAAAAQNTILSIKTGIAKRDTEILNLQMKQLNLTKQMREGYISAIAAMTAGTGMFAKLMIDQNKNLGLGVQLGAVIQGMKAGGRMLGGEAAGKTEGQVWGPGGISPTSGRTHQMMTDPLLVNVRGKVSDMQKSAAANLDAAARKRREGGWRPEASSLEGNATYAGRYAAGVESTGLSKKEKEKVNESLVEVNKKISDLHIASGKGKIDSSSYANQLKSFEEERKKLQNQLKEEKNGSLEQAPVDETEDAIKNTEENTKNTELNTKETVTALTGILDATKSGSSDIVKAIEKFAGFAPPATPGTTETTPVTKKEKIETPPAGTEEFAKSDIWINNKDKYNPGEVAPGMGEKNDASLAIYGALNTSQNSNGVTEIVGAQKSGTTAIVQTLERISELLQQYTKPPTYGDTNSGRRTDFT